jgi:hypothetical protein
MSDLWISLAALAATLLALLWVQRWITRGIQELGMLWSKNDPDLTLILFFVVVLPGVVTHELSHWLMAKVLGVRVTWPKLGPVRQGRSNRVSLGSVRVADVDPVRASLIGVAPLLGGSAVILLIGNLVLGVGELAGMVSGQGVEGIPYGLGQLTQVADFWLWLYLIFAVSSMMVPSESDMAAIRPVLTFLGIATAVVVMVSGVRAIPFQVAETVAGIAGYLAAAFGLTLVVNVFVILLIAVLLWITTRLRDRWLT